MSQLLLLNQNRALWLSFDVRTLVYESSLIIWKLNNGVNSSFDLEESIWRKSLAKKKIPIMQLNLPVDSFQLNSHLIPELWGNKQEAQRAKEMLKMACVSPKHFINWDFPLHFMWSFWCFFNGKWVGIILLHWSWSTGLMICSGPEKASTQVSCEF